MSTFIILALVSLMLLTFLLFKRRDKIMSKKHGKDNQKDKHDKHSDKRHVDFIAGELDVTGEDEIHIELPKRPKEVLALFSKHCHVTPCNPRHFDELRCYVCNFHRHHCLIIKWNVSNIRKIIWEAIF